MEPLGALLLQDFLDQAEDQAGRIALPGQRARRPPDAGFRRLAAGGRHLLLHQAPGGGDLLLGVEGIHRLADLLGRDALTAKLGG